jgi:hypothetical protein
MEAAATNATRRRAVWDRRNEAGQWTDKLSLRLSVEAQTQPIFGPEMHLFGHARRARSVCGPPLGAGFGPRGHIRTPAVRMRQTVEMA